MNSYGEVNQAKLSTFSRRGFLSGAALATVGVATAGLVGCAPSNSTSQNINENSETRRDLIIPENIAATYNVDIVIVGMGGSGATCATEAVENGLKVLWIDKLPEFGGGTLGGISGVWGINSNLVIHEATAQGIELPTIAEHVKTEIMGSQYRSNGAKWLKFTKESGKNVDWLVEKGAEFEFVSPDMGMHIAKNGDTTNYVIAPLVSKCEEGGAELLYSTTAKSLIMEGNAVVGLYAQNDQGDIQINAEVVVLATGGWNSNLDLITQQGWDPDQIVMTGLPGYDGDGYYMAMAAGAKDDICESTPMPQTVIEAFPGRVWDDPVNGCFSGWGVMSSQVLVNQDAVRFQDESASLQGPMLLAANPLKPNQSSYTIFSDEIFQAHFSGVNSITGADLSVAGTQLEEALKTDNGSIYKCNTIEECADIFGLDGDILKKTIDDYNEMCVAGQDTDFAKMPETMVSLQAPYYIGQMKVGYIVSLGGVATNIDCQATDIHHKPIPGLYVTGSEGNNIYRGLYTSAGGTMAYALWSGRVAAKSAAKYITG